MDGIKQDKTVVQKKVLSGQCYQLPLPVLTGYILLEHELKAWVYQDRY
jgi:hypothetical protein